MRRIMNVTVVTFGDNQRKVYPAKTSVADILNAAGGNMKDIKSIVTETRLYTMSDSEFLEKAEWADDPAKKDKQVKKDGKK